MAKQTKDVIERVAEAAEESVELNLIRLSSGVVLRVKQAPPLALIKVIAHFPRPKPPVYFNKAMGREMENPDDPEYINQLKAHQTESSDAVLNALILLGTELAETPKGFPGPDSNDWLEKYTSLGLTPHPENKSWRYLTWISFMAVANEDDLLLIRDKVGRISGVPEDAVKAAERFPGRNQNGGV